MEIRYRKNSRTILYRLGVYDLNRQLFCVIINKLTAKGERVVTKHTPFHIFSTINHYFDDATNMAILTQVLVVLVF